MEIIIAKNAGLCYGVKRALKIAQKARQKKNGEVMTLGDLIHNPIVIADLRGQDIQTIESPEELTNETVIIRSHGISPEVYSKLTKKKIDIIDATCPNVKKIQKLVEQVAKQKEEIIIVGDKDHPEIIGLIGYSQGKGKIIESVTQAKRLPRRKKRSILAQSTQDLCLFEKIVASLIEKTEELSVYNTICQSVKKRQESTSELASYVDVLFIVGGKNSSNTNTLFRIAKRIQPKTYLIEEAKHITPRMLKGARKIGLSGGASTPPEAIREAVSKIKEGLTQQYPRETMSQ